MVRLGREIHNSSRRVLRRKKVMISRSSEDRVFDAINVSSLLLVTITILYPLIFCLSSSFSSKDAIMAGEVWLFPVDFSLEAYKAIFEYQAIWLAYRNTLFYTTFGTIISLALTLFAAYPLSRTDFTWRKFYSLFFLFTMIFSGGLIPYYMLVRDLGMIDTIWSILIPSALSIWNVIITKTFFEQTIPNELLESARIDGCSDIMFFRSIVLPLSSAIIAVNALFYAVFRWNSYFDAFIFLNSPKLVPLQIVLRKILILNTFDQKITVISAAEESAKQGLRDLIKYAIIVVSSLPVLCAYPFVQKYFVKGIMIGAVKG